MVEESQEFLIPGNVTLALACVELQGGKFPDVPRAGKRGSGFRVGAPSWTAKYNSGPEPGFASFRRTRSSGGD